MCKVIGCLLNKSGNDYCRFHQSYAQDNGYVSVEESRRIALEQRQKRSKLVVKPQSTEKVAFPKSESKRYQVCYK